MSKDSAPQIVAELSGNHNQSLERALALVEAAAQAGVDSVKLQTYTADSLTIDKSDGEFYIADPKSLWQGKSLYQLYQEAYTPWEWHQPIFDRSRELGLEVFSTPFNDEAVDFLENLGVTRYKIASFENAHLHLIKKVAQTGKPMIIAAGMATLAELDETVRCARNNGCQDLTLLKCTSSYPASPEDSNILTIPHMRELFNCDVGLSDHTLGIGVAIAAVALGATMIEKHFTLSRADGGVDSAFSMEPAEMQQLVQEAKRAGQALGQVSYGPTEAEGKSLVFRRSLYVTQDVAQGELLTPKNIRIIRPGYGLPPKYLDIVLGRRAVCDIARGTALTWDMLMEV